jgi:hypothetical protein
MVSGRATSFSVRLNLWPTIGVPVGNTCSCGFLRLANRQIDYGTPSLRAALLSVLTQLTAKLEMLGCFESWRAEPLLVTNSLLLFLTILGVDPGVNGVRKHTNVRTEDCLMVLADLLVFLNALNLLSRSIVPQLACVKTRGRAVQGGNLAGELFLSVLSHLLLFPILEFL